MNKILMLVLMAAMMVLAAAGCGDLIPGQGKIIFGHFCPDMADVGLSEDAELFIEELQQQGGDEAVAAYLKSVGCRPLPEQHPTQTDGDTDGDNDVNENETPDNQQENVTPEIVVSLKWNCKADLDLSASWRRGECGSWNLAGQSYYFNENLRCETNDDCSEEQSCVDYFLWDPSDDTGFSMDFCSEFSRTDFHDTCSYWNLETTWGWKDKYEYAAASFTGIDAHGNGAEEIPEEGLEETIKIVNPDPDGVYRIFVVNYSSGLYSMEDDGPVTAVVTITYRDEKGIITEASNEVVFNQFWQVWAIADVSGDPQTPIRMVTAGNFLVENGHPVLAPSRGDANPWCLFPEDIGCGDDCPQCNKADDCDDSDPCTNDICESGQCQHPALDCDDGVDCTLDWCDPLSTPVCRNVPQHDTCDDADPCTKDWCEAGWDDEALNGCFNTPTEGYGCE